MLDLSAVFLARCIDVVQPVVLKDIGLESFKFSLPTIKGANDLSEALQRRYRFSSVAGSVQVPDCSMTTFVMRGLVPSRREGK